MKKAWKLAVVALLVLAGGALAFVGAAPEGYKAVGTVVEDPTRHVGRDLLVKATVKEGSVNRTGSSVTFVLWEPGGSLLVAWDPAKPLPENEAGGTIEGRTVVVSGRVEMRDGRAVLAASEMQVGCASKYEPAAPETA